MNEPLLEFEIKPRNITRGEDGRLRFEGVAMFENAVSGNRRFYPAEFIDESIVRTEQWVSQGHATTMHRSHESWFEGAMPIGKIFALRHEDGKMVFEAQISPTSDGSDMMTLIEDGVMSRVSLRSTQYESKSEKLEGETFDVMKWAVFEGIDFCERPGIQGAGIIKILEEAPKWAEENNMDWNEVTLEDVRANRSDLLEGYLREALGAFVTERDELKEKIAEGAATIDRMTNEAEELTARLEEAKSAAELDAATEQLESLQARFAEAEWKLARYEAAAPKWVSGLVEQVAECDQTELSEKVKELRDEVIASFTTTIEPKGKGEQQDADTEEDVPNGDGLLTPEIVRFTR